MYGLDANIWVYYFDLELAEHAAVREPVRSLLLDEPLFTTTVLQMEVVHYLHRQLADGGDAIARFLNLDDVTVAELTREDVRFAVEVLGENPHVGIGGRDATVVAAMHRYEVSTLWTHDSGLKRLGERLEWLTVVDPVEESGVDSD